MLLTAPSSIEHQAARRFSDNRKKYRFEGLSPPMALSLAIIWLTISANRSLNQASNRKRYRSSGIEPADGIIACDNLVDDLGKSQPQPSILQTICNVNAGVCYFLK
jgi:hypothetical protein